MMTINGQKKTVLVWLNHIGDTGIDVRILEAILIHFGWCKLQGKKRRKVTVPPHPPPPPKKKTHTKNPTKNPTTTKTKQKTIKTTTTTKNTKQKRNENYVLDQLDSPIQLIGTFLFLSPFLRFQDISLFSAMRTFKLYLYLESDPIESRPFPSVKTCHILIYTQRHASRNTVS